MTLSDEQVKAIIKTNPNKASIMEKRERSTILKAHVTGIGNDDLIKPIKSFERKTYTDSRRNMALSNKDVIARVMAPRNKIYTAKGGVESYTMANMDLVEEFRLFLSRCRGTQSLKDYIKQNIQPMFDYDPEGLAWLDLNNYGDPYPCFKSIHQIYDYELNGRKPEYVVFSLTKKEIAQLDIRAKILAVDVSGKLVAPPTSKDSKKNQTNKIFRVVCDSYDRLVRWDNVGEPEILNTIPNPFSFMGVPGIVVSNIVGASTDCEDTVYCSPLDSVVEILQQIIFSRSLYNVSYSRSAYPKEWMQRQTCPTCSGHKKIDSDVCPECKGTGALPAQQHEDVLIIDYRNDANKSIPTPPMGQVPADVEALRYMEETNSSWENVFEHTIWGVSFVRSTSSTQPAGHGGNVSGTAYEAQQNEQPRFDKLAEFTMWYSSIMKWYADGMGQYKYENNYIDSGILGGTRYMIESPDATFERLVKARTGGATKSELDSLTMEFLENKYANNPIEYRKYHTLFIAEPFYHDKIAEVITWDVPQINKLEKIFFDDWKATLTNEYFAMLPDDGLEERVKADLRAYVLGRVKEDTDADTLIFNAAGQLLNLGDKVTVKKDKAQDKSHLGQTYTVAGLAGRYAELKGQGETPETTVKINGYELSDLVKSAA